MAWTYFTAPLGAGEEISAAQFGELLDAIEERLAFYGNGIADLATIKASRLVVGTVQNVSGPYGGEISGMLESLAERFAAADDAPDLWDSADFRAAYLAEIGVAEADWLDMVASRLNCADYWNGLRAAVNLLLWPTTEMNPEPSLEDNPDGTLRNIVLARAGGNATWAGLMSSWPVVDTTGSGSLAASTEAVYGGGSYTYVAYAYSASRAEVFTVEASDFATAGVSAWVFVEVATGTGGGAAPTTGDTLTLTLGDGTGTASLSAAVSGLKVTVAGLGAGLHGVGLELESWFGDLSGLGGYEPSAGTPQRIFSVTLTTPRVIFDPGFAKAD